MATKHASKHHEITASPECLGNIPWGDASTITDYMSTQLMCSLSAFQDC